MEGRFVCLVPLATVTIQGVLLRYKLLPLVKILLISPAR